MQILGRVLVASDWISGEDRHLFITAQWPESAWRERCERLALIPKYIVTIRRK